MKKVKLKVDASSGAEVRAGDVVKAGDILGVDQKTGQKVCSPIDGTVQDCKFVAQSHEFIIIIKSR